MDPLYVSSIIVVVLENGDRYPYHLIILADISFRWVC